MTSSQGESILIVILNPNYLIFQVLILLKYINSRYTVWNMTQNVPEILVHIGAGAEGIKPKLTHVRGRSYLQILHKSRLPL